MKKILIIGAKLAIIGLVSALLLAVINSQTAPIIEKNRQKAIADALLKLAENGIADPADIVEYENGLVNNYYPIKQNETVTGYVLNLIGEGYGGDLEILAAYNNNGTVYKVKLMKHTETPGLGKKAADDGYMDIFIGKGSVNPIPVWKNELPSEKVDEITGASITYYGVAGAVKFGSKIVKNELGGENVR